VPKTAKQNYAERGSVSRRSYWAVTQLFNESEKSFTRKGSLLSLRDSAVTQSANESEGEQHKEGLGIQE
jgi:hypothetical protein